VVDREIHRTIQRIAGWLRCTARFEKAFTQGNTAVARSVDLVELCDKRCRIRGLVEVRDWIPLQETLLQGTGQTVGGVGRLYLKSPRMSTKQNR